MSASRVPPERTNPPGTSPSASLAWTRQPVDLDAAALLHEIADAIVVADRGGTLIAANAAAGRLFGCDEADLPGRTISSLMPARFRAAHGAAFERYVGTGVGHIIGGEPVSLTALRADGTEVPIELALGAVEREPDGPFIVATMRDVARQRAELLTTLAAAQRSQSFLLRASTVLAGTVGYAETLEQLARIAVPTLGDLCLIDVGTESGGFVRMAAIHADPARQHLADELREHFAPAPHGEHPSAHVVASHESRWSPEMPDEFLRATTINERHYQLVKELEFTSYMSVPLVDGDDVLGVITLVSAGSGRRFGPGDLALAEALAAQVALVVAKARRYDVEHRVSTTLQASLLPATLPSVPGLPSAVRYLPGTRGLDVGGDFYDVMPCPDGATFIVGDVTGHDMRAAATMGQLRSATRAFASHTAEPAALLSLLQRQWEALGYDRMATAVAVRINATSGRLEAASAGHPPPVLIRSGSAQLLPVDPGPPLGAALTDAGGWTGEIPAGATLLCYTDGLIENREQGIDAAIARLLDVCRAVADLEPESVCDAVLEGMVTDSRNDDIALLAVARRVQ